MTEPSAKRPLLGDLLTQVSAGASMVARKAICAQSTDGSEVGSIFGGKALTAFLNPLSDLSWAGAIL